MSENNSTPSADDGTLVQSPADAARILAAAGPVAVGVPGFEIESTLGRGGMGVVYKATQTGLNRVVALKMLIAGQYADPSARARFLLEAESVAALEHPHIIRVFAFGESGGHPYLAMEYVPGGTLAERVKANGPLPAKEATELLAKLAAAAAHAHSRGVVHRDIKPLNVMLTADGEPRLTDFGLAKVGRADQNLSITGQVLGTPAYMAPEQAAGKVREVGTAADVYALGAVFYDLLTGRPPFAGDSAAVTLQRVITEEPSRPRQLNASIPRDLETICLKCLEKDPAKRYPTAQALAGDLLRYLRNEPITVRPAGALERGYKWVKRNKVVAGAMTAVALALLIGSGVSLGFGLEANKQATEAKRQKDEADAAAEREKGEAIRADRERDDAIAARNETRQKSYELKRTLAQALFAPITTPYEDESFWRLAELGRDEVTWMFLEEATRTSLACKQLERRSEYAFHAAIGLDHLRRRAADQLLLSKFREPNTKKGSGVSLALAISRTNFASPQTAGHAALVLADVLATTTDSDDQQMAWRLSAVAARMDPIEAARVCTPAARALADALAKETKGSYACVRWAHRLSAVAAWIDPAEAARICTPVARALADALGKEGDTFTRHELTRGLVAMAARMDPAEAARALTDALGKEGDQYGRGLLAEGLAAVAGRMDPTEAARVWAPAARALADALGKEGRSSRRGYLAEDLAAVAGRMYPAEAAKVCAPAAHILADALPHALTNPLGKDGTPENPRQLAEGLAAVAGRMDPAEAAKVCAPAARILADALAKQPHLLDRAPLAEGLAAVAGRMDPAEAAVVCAPAAHILVDALAKETTDAQAKGTTDSYARVSLAKGLSAVAARMDPAEAARTLADALTKETNYDACHHLAEGLAAVAGRMDPAEAAKVCAPAARTLANALTKHRYPDARGHLAEGLAAVAGRMDPAEAAKVCAPAAHVLADALPDALTNTLAKEGKPEDPKYLAEGLATVAGRMDPAGAARLCAPAAHILVDALAKTTDNVTSRELAKGLAAVAGRMEPAEAARALADALTKETNPDARSQLVKGLATVAGRMDPVEGARALASALAKEANPNDRNELAEGLGMSAARMEPAEGAKVRAATARTLFIQGRDNGVERKVVAAVVIGLPAANRTRSQHATILAAGAFATTHNALPSLPLLHPHFCPQPRPLPPQTLVELLKHPFCVGEARRAVLDALEFTYKRPFKDQWEFVEYAQKHQPQLDLLSPPKRPQAQP